MGYTECDCCTTVIMGDVFCEACPVCECDYENAACRELLIDGNQGIYIPQTFARNFDPAAWGVSAEDIAVLLKGPDDENYWEVWSDVEGYVERDFDGKRWVLCQDGDLWAQCVGKAINAKGETNHE